MANPQKENGYTPIANELLDALIVFRIPGEMRQVFDAIIRKTYGFNKSEDHISNSQIVAMTKMKKQNVSRATIGLVKHKLVIRSDEPTAKGYLLKINKDYSQWQQWVIKSDDSTKKGSSATLKGSSKAITKGHQKRLQNVIRSDDHKRQKTIKDNIQKTGKDIEQARWARDIIESFSFINPAMKKMYGNVVQRQACVDLVEEYGYDKVMQVVNKMLPKTNAIAYFPTILTPHQLFNEWARLEAAGRKFKSKVDIKNQESGRGLA
jgi:phage replication O-like protein O